MSSNNIPAQVYTSQLCKRRCPETSDLSRDRDILPIKQPKLMSNNNTIVTNVSVSKERLEQCNNKKGVL